MSPITDEPRAAIAKQDAEDWRRYGCCLFIPLVLFILFLLGNYWLEPLFRFPTVDEIYAEIASPDGAYVAVVVVRPSAYLAPAEGGAERILLRKASEKFLPDSEGHINVEPVYHDPFAEDLEVTWKGKRKLLIKPNSCDDGEASKEASETNWNDVKIMYHDCEITR
jgi:hypothetical protein